jgi:hypothetical protein
MKVNSELHALTAFMRKKPRYPLDTTLNRPQSRCVCCEKKRKIPLLAWIESRPSSPAHTHMYAHILVWEHRLQWRRILLEVMTDALLVKDLLKVHGRPLCPIMSHMILIHKSDELLMALDSTVILGSKSRRTHVNILLSHDSQSRVTSPTHSVSLRSTSVPPSPLI